MTEQQDPNGAHAGDTAVKGGGSAAAEVCPVTPAEERFQFQALFREKEPKDARRFLEWTQTETV